MARTYRSRAAAVLATNGGTPDTLVRRPDRLVLTRNRRIEGPASLLHRHNLIVDPLADMAKLGSGNSSEYIKVVTGNHITPVEFTHLIQERVFRVRNRSSTAGVCPVMQHHQSRPDLVCQFCQLS